MSSTLSAYTVQKIRQINKTYVDAINPDLDVKPVILPLIYTPTVYDPNTETPYISYKNNLISSFN